MKFCWHIFLAVLCGVQSRSLYQANSKVLTDDVPLPYKRWYLRNTFQAIDSQLKDTDFMSPRLVEGSKVSVTSYLNHERPSEKELQLIGQFRTNVADVLFTEEQKSDHFLLRWIRARDGDLHKAEDMIRKSFKWRADNDIDNVLLRPVDPFLLQNYPYYIDGRDIEGRVVVEVPLGAWDLRKATAAGLDKEFQEFVNYVCENIMREIQDSNKGRPVDSFPLTQFTYIVDWEGYSYAQLLNWKAVTNLLKFCSQYESHYPEIMFHAVYINVPAFFPIMLEFLKTVLAPKTLSKIEMYETKREEWVPALDQLVSRKERGERFGGTLKHL